jgi:hypothetical protein
MQSLGVLGDPQDPYVRAFGVTADGSTVVGDSTAGAFIWNAPGPIQATAGMDGGYGISPDGALIVGAVGSNAVLLRAAGMATLGGFKPFGLSDDGGVVVGNVVDQFPTGAVWWTPSGGVQWLPVPSGSGDTVVSATTGDGRIQVGGMATTGRGSRACVWRWGTTAVDLADYLEALGLSLTGWQLQGVTATSEDGRTLVGVGRLNGIDRAWLVRLPPIPCSPDYNGDGSVATDRDIEDFFQCLSGNCCPSCTPDFNGDGAASSDADIEAFFRVLAGGPC